MGKPAATVGSTADNTPQHIPTPPGTSFQNPPKNKGDDQVGSQTVKINGKAAARNGRHAETCNDPADLPVGTVVASGDGDDRMSTEFLGVGWAFPVQPGRRRRRVAAYEESVRQSIWIILGTARASA